MAQKRTAAQRSRTQKVVTKAELREKYEATEGHLQALVNEEQALVQRLNEVRNGHGQMMGRLRVLAEMLGDVPPLTPVEASPNGVEQVEAPPEDG